MAKNWTVAEAAVEIKKGNKESILDIGKRYPLFLNSVARTLSGDADAALELLVSLPEYNTANKINGRLKEGVEVTASDEDDDTEAPADEIKAAKEKKETAKTAEKKEASGEEDYASMGAYPLYQLCKSRNIEVKSKRPKEEYIAALEAADKETSGGSDEEANEYEGKSAQELFKLCKSRKIEVQPKKPADYYVEKLEEADNESADDDGDNWDDDDAEPVKEEKKAPAKNEKAAKTGKTTKVADDDEWDI